MLLGAPALFGHARIIGTAKHVRCEKKVNGVIFKICLEKG